MGSTYKGGAPHHHSIGDNLPSVQSAYPRKGNHFGDSHNKSTYTYEIIAHDPMKEAKDFYDKIGLGGLYVRKGPNGMEIVKMKDGSLIVYRPVTSSDGSPAVEINLKKSSDSGGIKSHKIHFVGKKGKKK